MKNKFYIFVLSESLTGEIRAYPVHVMQTGKWLAFDDYTAAEAWIVEQRNNGNQSKYQIQKIYTHDS